MVGAAEVVVAAGEPDNLLTYPPQGDYDKYMYRPKTVEERILHRLQISHGHLKKVISMVESGSYCIDILHQSQALRSALSETENLIMENHLQGCVADDIKNGNSQKAISEVMSVIKHKN